MPIRNQSLNKIQVFIIMVLCRPHHIFNTFVFLKSKKKNKLEQICPGQERKLERFILLHPLLKNTSGQHQLKIMATNQPIHPQKDRKPPLKQASILNMGSGSDYRTNYNIYSQTLKLARRFIGSDAFRVLAFQRLNMWEGWPK